VPTIRGAGTYYLGYGNVAYVFVLLGSIIICRLDLLILEDRVFATLQLRISASGWVSRVLSGSLLLFFCGGEGSTSTPPHSPRPPGFYCVEASWNVMAHAQKPDFVFRVKRTSAFKLARASVQSTTGSRGVRISGSNAVHTMFWGSVKSTGYPLHLPVSLSLPLPCVTVCHHISTGVYQQLHLKYLGKLARYQLRDPWVWHDSVEACKRVNICEIICSCWSLNKIIRRL
jgi:hypothetical protein